MKILKLKPSFQVRVSGPAVISIERVWGSLVVLGIEADKDVDIKWGTRKRMANKEPKK